MKQEHQNILEGILLVRRRQVDVEAKIRRVEALLDAIMDDTANEANPDSDVSAPPFPEEGPAVAELESELGQLREQMEFLRAQLEQLEEDAAEEIWAAPPFASRKTKARREVQYKGFLSGLVLSWFVVALGAFAVLLSWKMLTWSADLLNMPVPVLVSFLLLFALSFLLQSKGKEIVGRILDLISCDFDEEDDYDA